MADLLEEVEVKVEDVKQNFVQNTMETENCTDAKDYFSTISDDSVAKKEFEVNNKKLDESKTNIIFSLTRTLENKCDESKHNMMCKDSSTCVKEDTHFEIKEEVLEINDDMRFNNGEDNQEEITNSVLKGHDFKKSQKPIWKLKVYREIKNTAGILFPLNCVFCNFSAVDAQSMIKHRGIHNESNNFPCFLCKFSTTNQNYLTIHLKRHTDEHLKCSYCPYKTKSKSNLNIHVERHTNQIICPFCKRRLLSKISLKHHIALVHTPITAKPYKCHLCNFASNYRSSVPIHLRDVHKLFEKQSQLMECDLCEYKTKKKSMLERHIMKHTQQKRYSCPYCNLKTTNTGSLNIHVRVIHDSNPPRPFKCITCEKSFKTKGSLTIHMLSHLKERTVKCPDCDFFAKSLHNLRSHQIKHSKVLYQCADCEYSSKFKSQLKKHVVAHLGPQLMCSYCGYSTPNARSLFAHSAARHSARPFAHQCSECGFMFASYKKTRLRQHIADCHKPTTLE